MFRTLKVLFFGTLALLLAGNLFMLVLQWYHGGHGGTANPLAIQREEFIDIVLSVVTVILGVIALQLAFFTFWGYLAIVERADAAAKSQAKDTAEKVLNERRINELVMAAVVKLKYGPEAPVDYIISQEYGDTPPAAASGEAKGSTPGTGKASEDGGRKDGDKP